MNYLEQARTRVLNDKKLEPHYHLLIEYDWVDYNHFKWLVMASTKEILDWLDQFNS